MFRSCFEQTRLQERVHCANRLIGSRGGGSIKSNLEEMYRNILLGILAESYYLGNSNILQLI